MEDLKRRQQRCARLAKRERCENRHWNRLCEWHEGSGNCQVRVTEEFKQLLRSMAEAQGLSYDPDESVASLILRMEAEAQKVLEDAKAGKLPPQEIQLVKEMNERAANSTEKEKVEELREVLAIPTTTEPSSSWFWGWWRAKPVNVAKRIAVSMLITNGVLYAVETAIWGPVWWPARLVLGAAIGRATPSWLLPAV